MSEIVAIAGSPDAAAEMRWCRSELVARWEGVGSVDARAAEGAVVGAAGPDWEAGLPGGGASAAESGGIAVAADARLHYASDLVRELGASGVEVEGGSAGDLILAAYRAWSTGCAARLEGEFSFALWDEGAGRLVAACDFAGRRPLYYADLGTRLVVGSAIGGIASHTSVGRELDLEHIAEIASGAWPDDESTCYRAVRRLPAGHMLIWNRDRGVRVVRHWRPGRIGESGGGRRFEAAAEELRELLVASVGERLTGHDRATVWMSGGVDSPAVFAAGQEWLRRAGGEAAMLRPVSISYPEGDPGREDDYIDRVARHWRVEPHWVASDGIPFLLDPAASAAARDEPFAHAFEHWNRALAKGTRACGSRLALDGGGGDQLFHVSRIYVADLLWRGRLIALGREWRATGGGGWRDLVRCAVLPNLPRWALEAAAPLRGGRALTYPYERGVPVWFRDDFVRAGGLEERSRAAMPRWGRGRSAAAETEFYLTTSYFPRVIATVSRLAVEEGVQSTSPLYDRRIVEFALSRPRAERASRGETKRLLRASMRGLLPPEVLAPRRARTGTTSGFFASSMRRDLPVLLTSLGASLAFADLGVIDGNRFRQAAEQYLRTYDENLGVALLLTAQTELWLRARTDARAGAANAAHGRSPAPIPECA